jgi:hypothetical protein
MIYRAIVLLLFLTLVEMNNFDDLIYRFCFYFFLINSFIPNHHHEKKKTQIFVTSNGELI